MFSIGEAMVVSAIGFSIVFAVLLMLMAVISLLRYATDKLDSSATDAVTPVMVPAKDSSGEVKLYDVDNKTAAMIMAIVADTTKIPLNELRFISIKKKGSTL